jgi:hypothetical protein
MAKRWRITIESTGPTWWAALAEVAAQLSEAIAIGQFVGTQETSGLQCQSRITACVLSTPEGEAQEGAVVRRVASKEQE